MQSNLLKRIFHGITLEKHLRVFYVQDENFKRRVIEFLKACKIIFLQFVKKNLDKHTLHKYICSPLLKPIK